MKQLPLQFKRNYRREAEEFYQRRLKSGAPTDLLESVKWFEMMLKENPDMEFNLDSRGYYLMTKRKEV